MKKETSLTLYSTSGKPYKGNFHEFQGEYFKGVFHNKASQPLLTEKPNMIIHRTGKNRKAIARILKQAM